MANYYDPTKMRQCAEQISEAVKRFETSAEAINEIVSSLTTIWDDEVNRSYAEHYQEYARKEIKRLNVGMKKFAGLMKQCAVKCAAAIDNGNSDLLS